MSYPEFKPVTVRKEHECCFCHAPIHKGERARYAEWREPREDEREVQVGINYVKIYMHMEDNAACMVDGAPYITEPVNDTL